jgi:hypothetical protein
MNYSDKLKDPRWQKKKTDILLRDKFTCQLCGDSKIAILIVHHKKYQKNTDPWDYDNDDLITLCEDCHKKIHNKPHIPTIKEIIELSQYEFEDGIIDRIIQQDVKDVLNSIKAGREAR